ncbi:MAG: phosphotransferase family protein [Ilumatobacter sp.]|uniref:phosphotransferase family protein n=1 Tax=Ilumatobacter sp. TaxID=1967498 RepID=UPI002628BA98|nr:phosphotransferase family protein [Ilumatobacter sp.]MDJ0771165.1 phosphotransferase family protein [Ilumatobacter sp.]
MAIDHERVSGWLRDHVDRAEPPFSFDLIVGGRSNLTYRVTGADGHRFVLRRPPTGHVLATAHDMAREHRIITAVGRTDVPVPRTLGLCTDEGVNGAPFYVMEFVDGEVLDSAEKAEAMSPDRRRSASEHLVEVLAMLHAADVDEIGLGDLARRQGYIERQIKRWSTQWANSKTRELAAIDDVAAHLAANVPEQQGVVVAHGDYRFGNCLTDAAEGRIAAVLDWELCTLGDPLADLGYLGVYWAKPGGEARHNDPTGAEGFLTFAEVVDRYAALTGRDVGRIGYYVAFSSWRLAVISEGVYARYINGAMGDQPDPEAIALFRSSTEDLATAALDALRSTA